MPDINNNETLQIIIGVTVGLLGFMITVFIMKGLLFVLGLIIRWKGESFNWHFFCHISFNKYLKEKNSMAFSLEVEELVKRVDKYQSHYPERIERYQL